MLKLSKYFQRGQIIQKRSFGWDTNQKLKVTVCGAAGNLGRVLSYFLKQSEYNLDLALYDTTPKLGELTKELNLINTRNSVFEYIGPLKLRQALKDSDIVAILIKTATTNSKIFQSDSFDLNFGPVNMISKCCIELCPDALIACATHPLNFVIPAINEIYKLHSFLNPHKIMGITAPDSMQAGVTYANMFSYNPADVFIPITGGTSEESMIPLFTQASPNVSGCQLSTMESEKLHVEFIRNKETMASSALAAGLATTRFIESLIRAILGEPDIVETAFVHAGNMDSPAKYMTSLIDLNDQGVKNVYGPPNNINRFEKKILQVATINLHRDISQAERYVAAVNKTEQRFKRVE